MWDGVESGPNRVPVRICCKGAPGRDRPRRKARNINDSLSALRLDRGLCNRFGQPAPPRPLGEAVTGRTATMTGASTTGQGPREGHSARENVPQRARSSLDPRDRRVTREHVCQRYVLAGQVTISAVTRRSPRTAATTGPAAPATSATPGAPDAETCTSHSKVQFQPSFSSAKCTSRRGRGRPRPSAAAGPARQLRSAPAQWAAKAMISASTSARVAGSLWTSWRTPVYTRVRMSRRPASHRPLATR